MYLIRSRGAILTFCILAWSSAQAEIPSASGDCVAGTLETTPSSDFTVLERGKVVRHETTGLEWRRCAEGMEWTGSGCAGFGRQMTRYEAFQHAHAEAGWRLPNINELSSIVEECRINPAINLQVFPNTSGGGFWSASPSTGGGSSPWFVYFSGGHASWGNAVVRVRLVRDAQ